MTNDLGGALPKRVVLLLCAGGSFVESWRAPVSLLISVVDWSNFCRYKYIYIYFFSERSAGTPSKRTFVRPLL